MNSPDIKIEFECPTCTKVITIAAELVNPDVYIKCGGCGELIPARLFYDTPAVSE